MIEWKSNRKLIVAQQYMFTAFIVFNALYVAANAAGLWLFYTKAFDSVPIYAKGPFMDIGYVVVVFHNVLNISSLILLICLFYRWDKYQTLSQSGLKSLKLFIFSYWVIPIVNFVFEYVFFKRFIQYAEIQTGEKAESIQKQNAMTLVLGVLLSTTSWVIALVQYIDAKLIPSDKGMILSVFIYGCLVIFSIYRLRMFKHILKKEEQLLSIKEHGVYLIDSESVDTIGARN